MVDFDIVKSMEHIYKYLKYRTTKISGTPPLTFKSKGRPLKNYRIYGNTVNGESVGEFVTEGEQTGKYYIPITIVSAKEIFSSDFEQGSVTKNGGGKVSNECRIRTKDYIYLPSGQYTISADQSLWCAIFAYINGQFIKRINVDDSGDQMPFSFETDNDYDILIAFAKTSFISSTEHISVDESFNIRLVKSLSGEIYLNEPLCKAENNIDYIEYTTQKRYNFDGTTEDIQLPEISTLEGTTMFSVDTYVQPSKLKISEN